MKCLEMAKWKEHEKEKKGAKVFCEKVKSTVQHKQRKCEG